MTEAVRVKIAVIAKYFKQRGTVSNLANRYDVSRTFIYMQVHLLNQMVDCWFLQDKVAANFLAQLEKEDNLRRLFRYRLVGGCSL